MKRILLSAALVAVCLAALAAPALAQSGNTWTINYYNNTDWAGYPVMTQYSPYISFNWGTGSPGPAVPADNFSARMTTDAFFYAGTYQFSAVADDEMTVIIDGVTYLDTRGKAQSGKSFAFNVSMWQGNHRIEVLYREFTVDAYIYLSWLYLSGETTPPPPPTESTYPPVPPSSWEGPDSGFGAREKSKKPPRGGFPSGFYPEIGYLLTLAAAIASATTCWPWVREPFTAAAVARAVT